MIQAAIEEYRDETTPVGRCVCRYDWDEHGYCDRCGATLCPPYTTEFQAHRRLCSEHLPPEERLLVELLEECARTLLLLATCGTTSPAGQGLCVLQMERLRRAGVDPEHVQEVYETQLLAGGRRVRKEALTSAGEPV
jgi:hypothetical protein